MAQSNPIKADAGAAEDTAGHEWRRALECLAASALQIAEVVGPARQFVRVTAGQYRDREIVLIFAASSFAFDRRPDWR